MNIQQTSSSNEHIEPASPSLLFESTDPVYEQISHVILNTIVKIQHDLL